MTDDEKNGSARLWKAICHADIAPPSCKLVLHTMAAYADWDHYDNIYPGGPALVADIGLDDSSIRKHQRALQELKVLVKVAPARRYDSVVWRIDIDVLESLSRPGTSTRSRISESSDRVAVPARPGSSARQTGHQYPHTNTDNNSDTNEELARSDSPEELALAAQSRFGWTRERLDALWKLMQTGIWDPSGGDFPDDDEREEFDRRVRDPPGPEKNGPASE